MELAAYWYLLKDVGGIVIGLGVLVLALILLLISKIGLKLIEKHEWRKRK